MQEHENIDIAIIDSSVEKAEEKARQLRGITISLEAGATAADVQWELIVFPNGNCSVQ